VLWIRLSSSLLLMSGCCWLDAPASAAAARRLMELMGPHQLCLRGQHPQLIRAVLLLPQELCSDAQREVNYRMIWDALQLITVHYLDALDCAE
jgi:hypothetical protein